MGASLLLAQADGAEQKAAIGNQTGGRVGFFLQTDDFWRDHARYATAGVVFAEEPREEDYGTVAVFEDKYASRWDLIQPPRFRLVRTPRPELRPEQQQGGQCSRHHAAMTFCDCSPRPAMPRRMV